MDHASNPRFAIYDYNEDNNPADESTLGDDLVLDKETGLIWPRDAGIGPSSNDQLWWRASMWCFRDFELGNRKGWRLPAIEELATLIDPSKESPGLPTGHPFINVKEGSYWSSTTATTYPEYALCVNFILEMLAILKRKIFIILGRCAADLGFICRLKD